MDNRVVIDNSELKGQLASAADCHLTETGTEGQSGAGLPCQ